MRDADVWIGEQRSRDIEVVFCQLERTTPGAAKPTRGGKARLGAFPDQTALEFRKRAKHVENQPPLFGRRVEGFGQAAKPDASDPQIVDGFDQLLHRARQPIEFPDDQRVAAAREFEGIMQSRPVTAPDICSV